MSAAVKQALNEAMNIPFNQIEIDEEENSRRDLTNIDKLAASIKESGGLLESLVVTRNPEGSKFPFRLGAGYRRAAALKSLKWGSNPVPATVTADDDRAIKNLVENLEREDLPSVDLAERLLQLENGEAPGSIGRKYTKKELAAKTGLSVSHTTNLIRAAKNLVIEVKNLWRKFNVPTTVVFEWSALSEEEQHAAIAKYEHDQKRIKERKAAAGESGDGSTKGKKGSKKGKKGEDDKHKAIVKGAKASMLENFKEVLEWQMETGRIKGAADKAAAIAQIDTLRFMLGDLQKFPNVTKADEKDHAAWIAEQNAAEEEAEEEETE